MTPNIGTTTVKKKFKKCDPKKGRNTQPNQKKNSPFHYFFGGVGAPSEGPALLYPLSLTNPLASTTFLFVLGHIRQTTLTTTISPAFSPERQHLRP